MKKTIALVFALCVLGSVTQASAAGKNAAGLGFDITGNFYTPADSRYSGIGTGVAITINLDENLTMGYRAEQLAARGKGTGAAGVMVTDNLTVTFQGINAFYKTFSSDKISVDLGLWLGSASADPIGAAATTPDQQSVMLEPMGRIVYTTTGKVDSRVTLGVGYRFVPGFNTLLPFGGVSKELENFNGLDLSIGVGLGF